MRDVARAGQVQRGPRGRVYPDEGAHSGTIVPSKPLPIFAKWRSISTGR